MTTEFLSPVGRYVQGSPFKAQTTDMDGKPLVFKTGPNAGQPRQQFFMAVAFAKTDPHWPAFEALLRSTAAGAFGHLFPQGPNGPCIHPSFAFKIVDGDGMDQAGKSNATKEGFAGHWVVRFTSGFAPQVFPAGKYSPMDRINDPNLCQCGHYVRVGGTIDGNGDTKKPGIYVNMSLIEHVGYGDAIVTGPDPRALFGATPAVLPPGARPTPMGAPGVATPTASPAPAAVPTGGAATASPGSYTGYMVPPVAAPPVPSVPAAPPAGPAMTAKANGVPYSAFLAQGWTDATLRANGYIA